MSRFDTIGEGTRARACRALHHEDPAAFGVRGCLVPDDDLVNQLCDRVEQLEAWQHAQRQGTR